MAKKVEPNKYFFDVLKTLTDEEIIKLGKAFHVAGIFWCKQMYWRKLKKNEFAKEDLIKFMEEYSNV